MNDAFGTAHRAHASTVGITKFVANKGMGLLMQREVTFLGKLLGEVERPFVAIVGGAKVSDKSGYCRTSWTAWIRSSSAARWGTPFSKPKAASSAALWWKKTSWRWPALS